MKKALITLAVVCGIAGAGYGAYRTGTLQKYLGRYLGDVIPSLSTDETEGEGRVSSDAKDAVYVDSVSVLAGLGSGDGIIEKFAGEVEPQETKKFSVTGGRTVDKTYVQEGDDVKKGDKLFSYDIDTMKDKLEQAKIDLERLQNTVDVSEAKQAEIDKQAQSADTPEKKLAALEAQNTLKQQKLELKAKKAKIESIQEQIDHSTVTSDIDGIVKSVNPNASGGSDDTGYSSDSSDTAYITLLKVGTYRIKASCNEQNISSIFQGERMLVHSRVDPSVTWSGTITKIKTDQGTSDSDQNSMMGMSGDSGSTDYPFYVELDSSEGLMLGQHVYLEQDLGQGSRKDGIWIDDYYFAEDDDGSTFVWAASSDNRLEKRKVELGEKDEDQQKTEVVSGLTSADYICQPGDDLKEGLPVIYNDESGDDSGSMYLYEETEGTYSLDGSAAGADGMSINDLASLTDEDIENMAGSSYSYEDESEYDESYGGEDYYDADSDEYVQAGDDSGTMFAGQVGYTG